MIYTVGDSHCWHAWLKIPRVITQTCGPMTMHSFGLSKVIIIDKIPKDAIVVFCWGEIDCRCHVHKYQPWQETIDILVKNYLDTIRLNAKVNPNIWIYNVVPPPRRANTSENPGFPFLGSDEERLSYVQYINKKLKESEFFLVDIYNKYCDKDGFLNMSLSDNHVHIANEKFLAEFIAQHRGDK
jgi:hypothetical protein